MPTANGARAAVFGGATCGHTICWCPGTIVPAANHRKKRSRMVTQARVLIVGAGPTGIGAAYRLKKLGHTNFQVIEAAAHAGGLASSYVDDNGFTWDIGGHVQFSHYDYFDQAMDEALGKEGWLHHERESWVWMADRFVPYPFQNNLRYLPKDMMTKAIRGLVTRPPRTPSPNQDFGSWVMQPIGEGLR